MNKKLKNALTITGAATLAAAASYGINEFDEKRDRKRYPQAGRLVEVRGRKMHVYSCGEGANTIVMITGRDTPTPSIDFKPLVADLSSSYRIAVPEPFGYGYSDNTSEPRTIQNVVDELRDGLRKAGIFPPYVLLGHALGGIATLYWASHYPREVCAVVGIDASLPAQAQEYHRSPLARPFRRTATFLSRMTPLRFFIKMGFMDKKIIPFTAGARENLPPVRSHAARAKMSFIKDNELAALPASLTEVAGVNYPVSCPVLMIVSSDSCSRYSGLDWLNEHEKIAIQSSKGKCVLLEGGLYLHHTAADAIAAEILAFIPPQESQTPNVKRMFFRARQQ